MEGVAWRCAALREAIVLPKYFQDLLDLPPPGTVMCPLRETPLLRLAAAGAEAIRDIVSVFAARQRPASASSTAMKRIDP